MWLWKKSLPERSSVRFDALARQILETKRVRAKGTYSDASLYLNRLIRHFGSIRIADITEIDWAVYVGRCKDENPKRKLFGDKKYMKQVILAAVRQEIITKPIKLVIPCAKPEAGREITQDELTRLFDAVKNPRLKFQMEIALKMGLRLREMLYLQWTRVDWEGQVLRLRPEDTKTRRGRVVPIPPELVGQFRELHLKSRSEYVFPSRFDPTRPQHDNKTAWRKLKAKANVRARWHDWRHTCATRLLRRDVSTSVARLYLGMTEKVLTRIYVHLNLDDLRKAAHAMSDTWQPPTRRRRKKRRHAEE